jgi:hypothetical protein
MNCLKIINGFPNLKLKYHSAYNYLADDVVVDLIVVDLF